MARLALALALVLSARALADEGCVADGTCQADEAEVSALLQSSAARRADVAQHGAANATTETTTLTCYPNYAGTTCGAAMKCFQDTTGCSSSGGGVCCKAAGNGAGLEQCKFCGDSTCGPCPDGPAPTPRPTPAPTPRPTPAPTPSCRTVNQQCGSWGSTGMWQGSCCGNLVCQMPQWAPPSASKVCTYPPTPAPTPSCRTVNQQCGTWGSTGQWQGSCCGNLECKMPQYAPPGASKVCTWPPPTPAPTPSGNQVGEKCGTSGSTGQYYGPCVSGLVCAPPANVMPGTSNVCANICGSFGSDGDVVTSGCNRMQSCSCRAQTPCSPWKPGAEGCYMYCC